jgi:glucuronoarabinoxylan endo-1,4-beta-xylanase
MLHNRMRIAWILGFFLLTAAPPAAPAGEPFGGAQGREPVERQAVTITIDGNKKRQTIAGFGGTVGWIYPPKEKLPEVADLLFKDLGVSILRLSALTKNGDPTDEGSPEPENDNADPKVIDWKRFDFEGCEAEQVAMARAAVERGLKTVVAASWSPPGWMKENKSRRWGGALRPGMEIELGELWAAYLVWMKKQGVEVSAVAIQNEPEVRWSYPTADFTPESLDKTARAVAARIRAEKGAPPVKLLYPEVSQLGRTKPYLEAASRGTLAETGAVSVHAYNLSVDYYDLDSYRKLWREARPMFAKLGKPLWLTEFSNSTGAFSGKEQGSWAEALAWARHMHLALVEGECSAVLFWGLYFDKKGEALIYAEKNKAENYEITPKFYTSKHFYKFIRPGAVRLECSPTEGILEASAFWHPERKELVCVIINHGNERRLGNFAWRGLPGKPARVGLHRTSEKEKGVELDAAFEMVDGKFAFNAQSVTTVVFSY